MSESVRLTAAYKELLARAVMGEQLDLKPARIVLGNGAYDSAGSAVRPPRETMYAPLEGQDLSPQVTRSGAQVFAEVTRKADAQALAFNEVAMFTKQGVMILHRTLAPQVISPGVSLLFRAELLPPEVY